MKRRLKLISGIMLTIFLVSMLSTVMSVSATPGWIPEDISGPEDIPDGIIDIHDIVAVANAFGSSPEDPNWNPDADLDKVHSPNLIDIFDLIGVAIHFGETAP